MRYFFLFGLSLGLCACAGNPPAWWNPSGAYGPTTTSSAISQKQTVNPAISSRKTEPEIPAEESIETSIDEYEELGLSDTGEVEMSRQTHISQTEEHTTDTTEQADPMYAPAEEHLPPDGSLPPPTVLE